MSRLVRENLVVASGTAMSRATGLLRISAIAAVLGQTLLSDTYNNANETPNIIYDLLLGGVLSATLVPLFTSYMWPRKRLEPDGPASEAEAERGTNVLITVSLILMLLLTGLAVLLARWIFTLYTLSPADNVDVEVLRNAGTILTRIFLVQILFYGLTGVANAYLNSRRRFAAAAWSPVAANLITIAALYSLPDPGERGWTIDDVATNDRLRWTLGLGATLGIAAMAVIVAVAAARSGLRFRPVIDFRHPVVRQLGRLSVWTIGFVAANQVALFVIRNLLGNLGGGNVSAYFFAFTFFMLPHGLFAVSISTTFQPQLARAVADGDPQLFADRFSLGTRSIVALTLPPAVVMIVVPATVMGLLQSRRFTAADAALAGDALRGLAIGLSAFSVYQFALRGFYAHKNSRTPFFLNVGENLLNIVVAFAIVGSLGLFGLGLSYALAYVASAVVTLWVLHRLAPEFKPATLIGPMSKMLLAAVAMGVTVYALSLVLPTGSRWLSVFTLTVVTLVGIIVYTAVLFITRADEVSALRRKLRPR